MMRGLRYAFLLLLLALPVSAQRMVELTILHYNDFHAQNVSKSMKLMTDSGKRERVDVGGAAVLKAWIDRERASSTNAVRALVRSSVKSFKMSSWRHPESQFLLKFMFSDLPPKE